MIGTAPARGIGATAAALPHRAPAAVSGERLRCSMLWLTAACGAVVFIEPSPYELMSLVTLMVFVVSGLTVSPALVPLGVLLVAINIGYDIAGWTIIERDRVLTWLLTSWYLAVTALFFAAMLADNTKARLEAVIRGYVAGAAVASAAAIIGYSRIVPALNEVLLLYDRARGTFKDPNVLGAFLVFPALYALQIVMSGNLRQAVRGTVLLGLFVPAILLSFSRAAWGQVVYTSLVVVLLTFVTSRSPPHRLRIVLLTVTGAAILTGFVIALLSIDAVAELFKQRALLQQSYDLGAQGRFARYGLGFVLALDQPLGIGPLQFSHYFTEDTHNSFLNAFMSGGWLAGASFPALVMLTLAFGFRAVFTPTPWQPATVLVFAGCFGAITESLIIDIDHWRHAFLLIGLMWGLIAANRRWELRAHASGAGWPRGTGQPLQRQAAPS